MALLKRNPSLVDQTKSHLKNRILNGEFDEGRIPSETILADELGISRTTVRDALSRLENEGVVYRKQGAGTFVNGPGLRVKTRLEEMWSYATVLREHGYEPSTRILQVREGLASEEVKKGLGLSPDETVLSVRKLFLQDDEPVILTCNHIPLSLLEGEYGEADLNEPVYEFVHKFGRIQLAYYLSDIVPIIADPDLAASLHIKPQKPLISFEEIGYNQNNKPIVKAYSYFRDDLLRLRLIRRGT